MPLNPLSGTPDYDFKPDTGLIQAYTNATQQKTQNDVSQQQSQTANIMKTVEMASQLAQTFVEQSKQRQQIDAVKAYASFNPNQKVSRATPLPEGQHGPMNIEQTTLGATPEGKQQQLRLLADVMGTAPTISAESIIKNAMPVNSANAGRGKYQQSTIQVRDPETNKLKTVSVNFETNTGKYYNPISGEEVTSPEQALALPERGYAQSFNYAGTDENGLPIIQENRTGNFIQGGDKPILPKLENPPASFTQVIAELGNAEVLLGDIVESFDPAFVGPIAARLGKKSLLVGEYFDNLDVDKKTEFYGNIAEYKNSIIKAITGAQMSEIEAKRIIQQIPDENASPEAFMSGLKRAFNMTQRRIEQQERAMKRSGVATRGEQSNSISPEKMEALINEKLGKLSKSGGSADKKAALKKKLGL